MDSLPVAASTWTFRQYPLLKALDVIHLLGITEVELWAEGVHLDPRTDLPDLEEVGSALDRLGLWPTGMHAPFLGLDLTEADETRRLDNIGVIERTMDVAAALDCAMLVVHVDGGGESRPPGAGTDAVRRGMLERAADALERLCDYGEELGITVLIENQPDGTGKRIGSTVDELVALIEQVGAPNLGICFDVAHAVVSTGDWESEWDAALHYIMSVHMSDTHGTDDDHLPLGAGSFDWERFVRLVEEADAEPNLVLEVTGGEEAVQQSMTELSRHVAE